MAANRPLKPVLDILVKPLPVLGELGVPLSFGDLLGLPTEALDFLGQAQNAVDTITAVSSLAGLNLTLPTFDLADQDTRPSNFLLSNADPRLFDALENVTRLLQSQVAAAGLSQFLSPFDPNQSQPLVTIPLISHPLQPIGLLMGRTADLVVVDLPRWTISIPSAAASKFPVLPFPPIFATFTGGIGFDINLRLGFDTSGFPSFDSSGDPNDLYDGVYLADNGLGGQEITELSVNGFLAAGLDFERRICRCRC